VPECEKCRGDGWMPMGCCSGHECGCMGRAVELWECPDCNEDKKKDIPKELLELVGWN